MGKSTKGRPEPPKTLRERATEMSRTSRTDIEGMPASEVQRLVHELQIHQIELELQNEELRETQLELAATRDRYSDLYELAPVGYLSLDHDGIIRTANLTFANLLATTRTALAGRKFADFVAGESRMTLEEQWREALRSQVRTTCELELSRVNAAGVHAHLDIVAMVDGTAAGSEIAEVRVTVTDITERVRAEEALRDLNRELEHRVAARTADLQVHADKLARKSAALVKSEATTTSILASLPGHIAVIDHTGTIVAVNPAWECFAETNKGVAARCNVGANYLEVCQNATGDKSAEGSKVAAGLQAILDGTADGFTIEYPCPSDVVDRWFLLQAASLAGEHAGAVVSHMDITDRVKAEQRLRGSEHRYRFFVEQTNDGFYRLDFEPPIRVDQSEDELIRQMYERGVVAESNDTFAHMYGYESGSVMTGARLEDLHGGADIPENMEAMKRFIRAGFRHLGVETMEIDREGEPIYLVNNSVGIIENGFYLSCWGTQSDITERKKAEDAQKSLGEIVEESLNEVYIFDAGTLRFLQVNRGGRHNLGYSMDELRELTPVDLTPDYSRKQYAALLEPLRAGTRKEVVLETRHRRKDGSPYHIESHLQMTSYRGRPCFLSLVLDTTQRRELEQEVLYATEEERQRIAHDLHDDLGSLLTGIKFRIEALSTVLAPKDGPAAESSAAAAALIQEAITKTRSIAHGLRPVGSDPEDLMSAMQNLAERLRFATAQKCRFDCPDPVLIEDPFVATHLFRIAQEAVNNAAKYSGGTRIVLSLKNGEDAIELAVTDDGKGIEQEAERHGGLGLHIMGYRADAINASLRIESRHAGGTEVVCTVPVPRQSPRSAGA